MVITKKYFTDVDDADLQLSVTKSKENGCIKFTIGFQDSKESELELTTEDVNKLIEELESLIYDGGK